MLNALLLVLPTGRNDWPSFHHLFIISISFSYYGLDVSTTESLRCLVRCWVSLAFASLSWEYVPEWDVLLCTPSTLPLNIEGSCSHFYADT